MKIFLKSAKIFPESGDVMNTCYIIGAGNADEIIIKKDKSDLIICADGGLKYAESFGIVPDLIVGDFDSYGSVPKTENVIVHPAEKNETDTHLAIEIGLEKGFRSFVMFGMLGGRLDHTYANLQLLSYLCGKGARGVLADRNQRITVIKNSALKFSEDEKGLISVFSVLPESRNIKISGFKYEVENFTMYSDYPRGVSNEFAGKEATISVEDGELLIMWEV